MVDGAGIQSHQATNLGPAAHIAQADALAILHKFSAARGYGLSNLGRVLNLKPKENRCNSEHGKIVLRSFLIACRNATKLLEAIDCAFDAIALTISLTVKACPLSRCIGATGKVINLLELRMKAIS